MCQVLLAVAAWGLTGTHVVADDTPQRAENGAPLVVRDVAVFLLSAYGTQLNERGLFSSTLPSYTLSRRPTASRDSGNDPTPGGIITFSGPPEDDVDVLLEFDSGRFLSHWPPGRMRSKRLLWASIDLRVEPAQELSRIIDGHWLLPLRAADRLYVAGSKHSDRFLLYDAELPYAPHVSLQRAENGYTVTNSGRFPIRDVRIYRPLGPGEWEVAATTVVEAAKEQAKEDGNEETPASSPAPHAETTPQPAAATPVAVQAAVVAEAEAAAAAKAPAKGTPPNQPSPDQAKSKTATATSAPAQLLGTLTADEAMAAWRQSLAELHLEQPEIDFALAILRQQALRSDSAMLLYRLDEVQLEQLLPLEVTPYPDRLFRVALVIVQDADPDLQSRIESLVAQLGHDEWRQREQAQKGLAELGLAAKPKLEAALKNKDAEIVFRAEQLLEAIKTTQ